MESRDLYQYEKYSFRVISPLMALIALTFLFNAVYIGAIIFFVLGVLLTISYQDWILENPFKTFLCYHSSNQT